MSCQRVTSRSSRSGGSPMTCRGRRVAEDLASRLDAFLDGRTMGYGEAGDGLGEIPNRLRYAATTGRVLIRWDGARQPTIWTVPPPDVDPRDARLELARRYLHVFGPGTAAGFAQWAGIGPAGGRAAFEALAGSLTPVRTPVGEAWILTADEPTFRAGGGPVAPARLLPSGDAYYLLQGADRELLVPDPDRRDELWTSAGLAGRRPRGGRHRRDLETCTGGRHDRVVATPLTHGACRRGSGGRVHAVAWPQGRRSGPVGRLTRSGGRYWIRTSDFTDVNRAL